MAPNCSHQHTAFHQHAETKEEITNSLSLLHRIIYFLPFRQDLIVNILDQRKRKVGHLKAEFVCSDTLRVRRRVRLTESHGNARL